MIEVLVDTSRDYRTGYTSGFPEGVKPPVEAIEAVQEVTPSENKSIAKVTPLVYESPNPNSRFGTHPPREVYANGFPNWYWKQESEKRITFALEEQR